jgi:hypothetical protein
MPPRIKAFANYHNGRLAKMEALENAHDWPIMLNDRHQVSEGSGGVLESITRATVCTLLGELGVPVLEREIDRTELYLADEIFFIGTGWEILTVLSIDGVRVGDGTPGPITSALASPVHTSRPRRNRSTRGMAHRGSVQTVRDRSGHAGLIDESTFHRRPKRACGDQRLPRAPTLEDVQMPEDVNRQAPSNLSGILGFSSSKFIADTFGREPLHIPGASSTAYKDLVTLDALDEILSFDSTRPPYVRVFKDGMLVDREEYTYTGSVARTEVDGLLDHGRLMDQFDRGATIVLDSTQHWLPAVRDLCDSLQQELGAGGRATAFISPPRKQALEPHADSYEIFVLQIAGAKQWSLYPRLDPPPPAGVILRPEDLGDEPVRAILEPGDLLYLPWGTPHVVNSLDSFSAHLAIALRPPTWGELLQGLIAPIVNDERMNGPALMGRGREAELAGELSDLLGRVVEGIRSIDPSSQAERFVSRATEDRCRRPAASLADLYKNVDEGKR